MGSRSLWRGWVSPHGGPTTQAGAVGDARLTVALLPIGQEWWDDDAPLLPGTHAQQALVHALDQPASAHIRIVGAVFAVADVEE